MGQLLGPSGRPISSMDFKKAPAPALGPSFGDWAGRDIIYNQMPGGAILQFDLSQLTLTDFRAMRWNPQINASLSVLTFMLHQVDWHVESDDADIQRKGQEMFEPLWTRLIRGLSQSFWAGYSPIAIEYDNNIPDRRVDISKFKDLIPEDCQVKWKKVEGALPPGSSANSVKPKFNIFDGIKQYGSPDIPPAHSLWYPLLMENGDHYGRKLLKACFAPWYFSTLVHLFANRYYERFGEPVPIGRAPFDEDYPLPGTNEDGTPRVMSGREAMELMLMSLRNRSTVTLPSNVQPVATGTGTTKAVYEYDIEYLESQMRGADFERYLSRLDEEMSLGLFTPLLLLRNADVGSHNLGVQHTQTWLWMLNALTGDMKEYIDRYPFSRWVDYNFGPNAKRLRWVPHKLGKQNVDMLRAVITALVSADKVKFDVDELGQALGLTLTEIKTLQDTGIDPATGKPDTRTKPKSTGPKGVGEPRATGKQISNRIKQQVTKAWDANRFDASLKLDFGYHKRFIHSLRAEGYAGDEAESMTNEFFDKMGKWSGEVVGLGMGAFTGPDDFMSLFDRHMENLLEDFD